VPLDERDLGGHVVERHDHAAGGVRRHEQLEHPPIARSVGRAHATAPPLARLERRAQRAGTHRTRAAERVGAARLGESTGAGRGRAAHERGEVGAEQRLRRRITGEQLGRAHVGARHAPVDVDHGHPRARGVEGDAPLARGLLDVREQPRVDRRHGEQLGEAAEHARVGRGEVGRAVRRHEHAHRTVGGDERRRDELLDRRDVVQRERGVPRGRHPVVDHRRRHRAVGARSVGPRAVGAALPSARRVTTRVGGCDGHGAPRQRVGDGEVGAGEQLGRAGAGHHLQVLALHERDERALGAEQGERVPQAEAEHLAGAPRAAHGARERHERLALPPLRLALGEGARVRERHRRLRCDRAQQLLVGVAERRRRGRVHGEHAHETRPHAHRHRKHARRRPGVPDHVVVRGERRARGIVRVHPHGATRPGHLADRAAAQRLLGARSRRPAHQAQRRAHAAALDVGVRYHEPVVRHQARHLSGELAHHLGLVERPGERHAGLVQPVQALGARGRQRGEPGAAEVAGGGAGEQRGDLHDRLGGRAVGAVALGGEHHPHPVAHVGNGDEEEAANVAPPGGRSEGDPEQLTELGPRPGVGAQVEPPPGARTGRDRGLAAAVEQSDPAAPHRRAERRRGGSAARPHAGRFAPRVARDEERAVESEVAHAAEQRADHGRRGRIVRPVGGPSRRGRTIGSGERGIGEGDRPRVVGHGRGRGGGGGHGSGGGAREGTATDAPPRRRYARREVGAGRGRTGTSSVAARGTVHTTSGATPSNSPSACAVTGGSVSMRNRRPGR
jgi:hypothetical protein